METKDLMIGDLVINTEFGQNKVDTVEIVEPRRVWLTHGKTYIPFEYIEPIPLTTEILEKNGFVCIQKDNEEEEEYECWRFTEGLVTILYEPNVTMLEVHFGGENGNAVRTLPYYTDGGVIYVHELQHLLNMCHIKKDIEL